MTLQHPIKHSLVATTLLAAATTAAGQEGSSFSDTWPRARPMSLATQANPQDVAEPVTEAPEDGDDTFRVHATVGADVTTAYYFRGIFQEDSGLIIQPYADFTLDVLRFDRGTVSVNFGMWNSFHSEGTASATTDNFTENWYESDLYAGVGLSTGDWSFSAGYAVLASPSGAFGTVDEISLGVSFDDSTLLEEWALAPSATLIFEVGSNAADGGENGVYLELGIEPGFSVSPGNLEDISISFPLAVGLSLSDYYEGTGGEDDVFGFVSVGVTAEYPLPVESDWGAWSVTCGVQGLFLGDAASTFNSDDSAEIVGTLGVSLSF